MPMKLTDLLIPTYRNMLRVLLGLLRGVGEAAGRFGFALDQVGLLLHGTTIATNAVLERKLARGVLLTTAGFEDVLEITRHVRRELYAVDPDPFPCLVERDRRLGVAERMRADGSIETPLDEAAIPGLLARLDALGAEAVAVCLLHSYVNPAHEQRLKALLRRHGRGCRYPCRRRSARRSASTNAPAPRC